MQILELVKKALNNSTEKEIDSSHWKKKLS
jgi:hypothetical protein